MWVHETFSYLITEERAYATLLHELISSTKLDRRFDPNQVSHISSLWTRVQKSFEVYKSLFGRTVTWQCEDLTIPFENLSGAALVEILSESGHPTDGNDFLFLIIHQIIDMYNVYARKLSSILGRSEPSEDLDPTYLMPGLGGMAQLEALAPLSIDEITWVAGHAWNAEKNSIDDEEAKRCLSLVMDCNKCPRFVSDPLNRLRHQFCFRKVKSGSDEDSSNINQVHGYYFANSQDADLVERLDMKMNLPERCDASLESFFLEQFGALNYEDTRAIIEGCGAFVFESEETRQLNGLASFGFPDALDDSQICLIEGISSDKILHLISFAAHRLASEGYVFWKLPTYLWYAAPHETLSRFSQKLRTSLTADDVTEFATHVLCFCERFITNKAAEEPHVPLRIFLESNGLCGEEDAVFQLLPMELELRHYAVLQQQLHQDKLALRSIERVSHPSATGTVIANDDTSWLLDDELECARIEDVVDSTRMKLPLLWFEQEDYATNKSEIAVEQYIDVSVERIAEVPLDHPRSAVAVLEKWWKACLDHKNQTRAASIIQFWWRQATEDLHESIHRTVQERHTTAPTAPTNQQDYVYGSEEVEHIFRVWLADNKLPASIYEELAECGVRTVADLSILAKEIPSAFDRFPILDQIKLKKALQSSIL
jgi:hypothetical protein